MPADVQHWIWHTFWPVGKKPGSQAFWRREFSGLLASTERWHQNVNLKRDAHFALFSSEFTSYLEEERNCESLKGNLTNRWWQLAWIEMEITEEHIFIPQAMLYYNLQSTFSTELLFGSGIDDRLEKRAVSCWHGSTAKQINLVVKKWMHWKWSKGMYQNERVRWSKGQDEKWWSGFHL